MKRALMMLVGLLAALLSIAAAADAVCHTIDYVDGADSSTPFTVGAEMLSLDAPLVEGGVIECRVRRGIRNPRGYELSRVEKGIYSGLKYRIWYSDGSGVIQGDPESTLETMADLHLENWSFSCKADEIDDSHWCSMRKKGISVGVWKDGSGVVSVGHSHYPGSSVTIRVDKNAPITKSEDSSFSQSQTKEILDQLRAGTSAVTRYQEWPYQSNKDTRVDLFGFAEGFEFLNLVHKSASVP